ncbi:MAG TPA: TIGR02530 family flagellar biosynthesis protein [Virgibacillus sp.]|nr:TIGR02530 family flagellar biosynthesis protein [Virgibacillus sp.]
MTHRIHPLQQHYAINTPPVKNIKQKSQFHFKDVLTNVQDLKISKHAKHRLQERNIHIDEKQWKIIGEKVSEAKQKGVTDSLVVMDQSALLVSTKNNTVVTAMNREEATSKIFTNINGTILIDK